MASDFLIHGDICYSVDKDHLIVKEDHYLVIVNHKCKEVISQRSPALKDYPVYEYPGLLVIPGLIDLHIHASQYAFRGLSMDLNLLEWLKQRTFPEEEKFSDLSYARDAYEIFTQAMRYSATTRACIFATIHVPATLLLMQLLEKTGLITYVGKLSMDRNAPDSLIEEHPVKAVSEWLSLCSKMKRTFPILTPRFVPSCSDKLLKELGLLREKKELPVQSHLSEAINEVEWVEALCPNASCYAAVYEEAGLLSNHQTIMAHCVVSSEDEVTLLKKQGVVIAHCPASNMNLCSGIAPVKNYLKNQMYIGLGSDVAGGTSESIFVAMADAISVSKLRNRYLNAKEAPLTMEEVFYMGTMGGGQFFGKVGSFLPGYELDAIVIDDSNLPHPQTLTVRERLERIIYLSERAQIVHKFVAGTQLF